MPIWHWGEYPKPADEGFADLAAVFPAKQLHFSLTVAGAYNKTCISSINYHNVLYADF